MKAHERSQGPLERLAPYGTERSPGEGREEPPAPVKARARLRRQLARHLRHGLKRRARPALNRFLARYSEVGDPAVFESSRFPWIRRFEQSYPAIRAEALQLTGVRHSIPAFHEVSPYQRRIADRDRWKTLWLYGFGYRSEIATRLCPVTARLLEEVPGLQSACFSILAPGTHIKPHRGVYKGLINFQLALAVPKQDQKVWMRVGDQRLHWTEGESLVFDDTNLHEVHNDTSDERIVLLVQFHRPLRGAGRVVSRLFLRILRLTPYLRVPMRNIRVHEAKLQQAAEQQGLLDDR